MALTITSIMPSSARPGETISIRGTGFVATPRVIFGTEVALRVTFISATEIQATVPLLGAQVLTLTVENPDLSTTTSSFEVLATLGWGLEPFGTGPYGASLTGATSIRSALAISTREVLVTVNGLVQDNSPFLAGDALNPSTWQVQRLDTNEYLHVVAVTQTGTFSYKLLCLEEFGSVLVTHRASAPTLNDVAGSLIGSPRQADFLGIIDEDKINNDAKLAKRKLSQRDYANAQAASATSIGGTLVIDAGGDYQTVTGPELVKKLILRRLMTQPRDFFHLPNYGLGLRVKEPLPLSDLGSLVTAIESQVLEEPEVESVQAQVELQASTGVLTVRVRARMRKTGQEVSVGYTPTDTAVVL